jgi:hypothetical protein
MVVDFDGRPSAPTIAPVRGNPAAHPALSSASPRSAACCIPIRGADGGLAPVRGAGHVRWRATSCRRPSTATPPTKARSTCRCSPTPRTCRNSPRRSTPRWTRPAVGLPDRRPRPVRLGPHHGRGAPPPGGLRIPARLRTGPAQGGGWHEPLAHRASSLLHRARQAMSRLRESDPAATARRLHRPELEKIGVTFERWKPRSRSGPAPRRRRSWRLPRRHRPPGRRARLQERRRGQHRAGQPATARQMRGKFLDEHYHKEDEVRFFVAGSGCSPCTWATRSTRSNA